MEDRILQCIIDAMYKDRINKSITVSFSYNGFPSYSISHKGFDKYEIRTGWEDGETSYKIMEANE